MTNAHARVVHVITGLGDGGAEGALTRLVLAERPNAPEPCVISLTGGGRYADVLTDAGVEVVTLNMRRGRPSLTALSALRRQLRRGKVYRVPWKGSDKRLTPAGHRRALRVGTV